jgi:hypothetical protein
VAAKRRPILCKRLESQAAASTAQDSSSVYVAAKPSGSVRSMVLFALKTRNSTILIYAQASIPISYTQLLMTSIVASIHPTHLVVTW